jgi:inward rectifier potassium channel
MNSISTKQSQDLGLGSKVVQSQKKRYVNRDGSFNVYRKGVFNRGAFSLYHAVLEISWPTFYAAIFGLFVIANAIFAILYLLTGLQAFPDLANLAAGRRLGELFLFSVQILTTLGASPIHPVNTLAKIILDLESTAGLLGFALATGMIFARFSNPPTNIIFSDKAVIAPYNGITGFMFRIINGRNNELIEVGATVTLAVMDESGQRDFHQLTLERDKVMVFPLNWTIVHPIDPLSPIYGMSADDLAHINAEFTVFITAMDKDLSKRVYARFSYLYEEVVVGAQFATMIEQTPDGRVAANPDLLHEIEKISS